MDERLFIKFFENAFKIAQTKPQMPDFLLPDKSIFVLWFIFMAVFMALSRWVIGPTLEIIEKRRDNTDHLKETTEKMTGETKTILAQYEDAMAKARLQASQVREALVSQAREEERKMIASVRLQNEDVMGKLKLDLDHQKKEALLKLKQYSQELARDMVTKILERKVA